MKNLKLIKIVLLMLPSFIGFSQPSFTPPNNASFEYERKLQQVTFINEHFKDRINLLNDFGVLYGTPQWTANTGVKNPVAYISGKKPKVKAVIETDCPHPFWIKADGPDNIHFPPKEVTPIPGPTPGTGLATYSFQVSTAAFPADIVKYYEAFELKWKFCDTNSPNEDDWAEFGTSDNELYLTLQKPIFPVDGTGTELPYVYHTVIHLSCKNANNLSDPQEIVDAAFTPFSSSVFDVRRLHDNKRLTYYETGSSACQLYPDLLNSPSGDGRCGAFSAFFEAVIEVQGINAVELAMFPNGTILPSLTTIISNESIIQFQSDALEEFGDPYTYLEYVSNYFLVKNWFGTVEGSFIELFTGIDPALALASPGDIGLPGQGNVIDPISIFSNHGVVVFNNQIYDPSYGVHQANDFLGEYEQNGIDVVRGAFVWRPYGPAKKWYFWVESNNTPILQDFLSVEID